jgi:hypothetical protein
VWRIESIIKRRPILGSSAPSTPLIYCNLWRAGGEDTAFVGTQNPNNSMLPGGPSKKMKGQPHCSIEQKFTKPFVNIAGSLQSFERGDTAAEIVGTVADHMKRTSNVTAGYFVGTGLRQTMPFGFHPGTSPTNKNYYTTGTEFFHYFSAFFLFWKGSRILRRWVDNTENGNVLIGMAGFKDSGSQFSDGVTLWSTSNVVPPQNRDAVQVHWQSCTPYDWVEQPGMNINPQARNATGFCSSQPNDLTQEVPTPANDFTYLLLSAGDDFTLMYPIPFFPAVWYPNTTSATTGDTVKLSSTGSPPSDSE